MTLSRFVKTYNNLPLGERNLACCVIDGEAASWKLAYEEIKEDTESVEILLGCVTPIFPFLAKPES